MGGSQVLPLFLGIVVNGGFLMRRLENVRGEFSLTALAYNIRRATTLVGIPELIAAVRP